MNEIGLRPRRRPNRVTLLGIIVLLFRRRRFIGASTLLALVLSAACSVYTALLPQGSHHNPLPDQYSPQAEMLMLPSQNAALSSALGNASTASSSALSALSGFSSIGSSSGLSSLFQSVAGSGATVEKTANFVEALLIGDAVADDVAAHFDFAKRYGVRRDVKTRTRAIFRSALWSKYDNKTGILTISYTNTDKVFATKVLAYTLSALEGRLSNLSAGKAIDARDYLQRRIARAKVSLDEARAALISFEKTHGISDLSQQAQLQTVQILSLEARIQSDETQLKALARYPALKDQSRVTQLNTNIEVSKNLLSQLRTGGTTFNINAIPENQLPAVSVQYANLSQEVSLQNAIYSSLRQQYETARLEANGASKWFQVIQSPQVPEMKSGPNRLLLTILVVVVVFVLAVIIGLIGGRIEELDQQRLSRSGNRLID